MNSPAPTPLGNRATTALGSPCGHLFKEQLDEVSASSRSLVILHQRESDLREMTDAARSSLSQYGWGVPWSIGGVCTDAEDVASFAAAGYTWYHLASSPHLEMRADTMSLDDLDAAIIALEDNGCYSANWHESYLDGGIELANGTRFHFTDETLARAAVKFGRALQHADQLNDALRTLWSGRDVPPDIEISIANSPAATTPAELVFLVRELLQRGIGSAGYLRVAPAFGRECEPGSKLENPVSLPPDACPPGAALSVPAQFASDVRWNDAHHDNRQATSLIALRFAATHAPQFFREWLAAACEAFPSSRGGRNYSTTDDDIRFLPQVKDTELAETFLNQLQGRQLVLVTWDEVYRQFGAQLTALLAGHAR